MIRDNHKQFMEGIMEPEHSKQGTARGSTALSGKKVRFLALALLLAVMAGGGLAIGEETNVSGQAKQKEAEAKDIILDGPIRPTAIITKDGIVILKYKEEDKSETETQTKRQKKENVDIVPGLIQNFAGQESNQRSQDDRNFADKMRRDWAEKLKNSPKDEKGNPLPLFYDNFQIKDAKNLETEYIVELPEFVIDREKLRKEQESPINTVVGRGIPFPENVKLKWKHLGTRMIEGKKHIVWQTGVRNRNAKTIGLYIVNFDTGGGSFIHTYSLKTDKWDWNIYGYKYPNPNHQAELGRFGTRHYDGDTIVIELILPLSDIRNPNSHSFFVITGVTYLVGPELNSSKYNPPDNTMRITNHCPIYFCSNAATDPWFTYSLAIAHMKYQDPVTNKWDLCTGYLINNYQGDLTPYFMTAGHCIEGLLNKINDIELFFHSACAGTLSSNGMILTDYKFPPPGSRGAILYSLDDYALFKLTRPVPAYNNGLYFLGTYTSEMTGPVQTEMIGHPTEEPYNREGDLKQLTIFDYDKNDPGFFAPKHYINVINEGYYALAGC